MIGIAKPRIDGPAKVQGQARYAVEYPVDNPLYAVIAKSTVAKGTIRNVDSTDAEKIPGIVQVIHAGNALKLTPYPTGPDTRFAAIYGESILPLQQQEVVYVGQAVAVVIATRIEDAWLGASRIKIDYDIEEPAVEREQEEGYVKPSAGEGLQYERGDLEAARAAAAFVVSEEYSVPTEHHNPMEMGGTTVLWNGQKLTVYDATQGVANTQACIAHCFGLPPENVRVIAHYVGGGFGCKAFFWSHTLLAAMAAKITERPVKLILNREDMYTLMGHRPETFQRITLASDKDGKISGAEHITSSYNSETGEHFEPCGITSARLYNIPNFAMHHRYLKLNLPSPTYMRGPGESNGTFALESAMDELALKLDMDPVELRMHNYAASNLEQQRPYSSNKIRECYQRGAELFGWQNRNQNPGKLLKDGRLVGHGMASASYPANLSPGSCTITLSGDGSATVQTAVQDIGTGTYTVVGQITADALGIASDRVEVEIGDSDFPRGPMSGGSQVTASVGNYIIKAAEQLKKQLIELTVQQSDSPHYQASPESLTIAQGTIRDTNGNSEAIESIIRRSGQDILTAEVSSKKGRGFGTPPSQSEPGSSFQSFGAVFAEASIDPDLGVITIPRIVGVYDVGTIINPKLAMSQLYGGIIFGYSMALLEATEFNDTGRIVNADYAEYHVPVNADINDITVEFLNEPDYVFSKHGGRGLGEIGTTGTAAAIANAIYNATGKRIRSLPITLDKLL